MLHAAAGTVVSLSMLVLAGAAAGQPSGGRLPSTRLEVPYISQDEQLCGGAAAAMLLRANGVRGVYASDFASLVDAKSGGIHTRDLESALRARVDDVRTFSGNPDLLSAFLGAGVPVMALLEDRPGRYHYVVVVGWSEGTVIYHDPARAPFLTRDEVSFARAWRAAGHWMLTAGAPTPRQAAARAVASPPVAGETAAATERFVEKRYAEAARLAWAAAQVRPADTEAWRILAASRYLLGDAHGALDAWNQVGDPRVDLVQLEGLSQTPHRTVERLLGIETGVPLTSAQLVRADRRLALLPSRQVSRVSYVALPGNLAEVRGAVVERPRYPSRAQWILEGARLPIDRELGVSLANLAQAGDRLTAGWRFWEGRPRAALEFRFPASALGAVPGILSLSSDWQQESFTGRPGIERRTARLSWTDWVSPRARLTAGAGVGRWEDRGGYGLFEAGLQMRPLRDSMLLILSMQGAAGQGPGFASAEATFHWRATLSPRREPSFVLTGGTTVTTASRKAPPDYWPGAGADPARSLLLRAHPLLRDGAIDTGRVFGRTVFHHTTEIERDVWRHHLLTVGVAGFADIARAWNRLDGSVSPLHVDAGAGLRLRVAPGFPAIRVDLARGLRDGRMAVSAGWQLAWPARSAR